MTDASENSRRRAAARVLAAADRAGMLLVLIALFAYASRGVPNFLSPMNLVNLALSVAMVGMVACTMLFCMVSGDFDLSVEAILAFTGVLAAVVITQSHSVALGVAAGIAAGGAVGLVNGFVIAKVGINALIATLASMQIVRGMSLIVSGGSAVGVSEERFFWLGNGDLMKVPIPVWLAAGCIVLFGVLLHKTRFGRHALAIGGNRESARLAGVPVTRTRVVIFGLQGLVAGFAGVVLASQMTSGQPNTSVGFSLDVISACVLGGVSLSGGVGSMAGVVVGVLIMGTVQNIMDLRAVPAFYQYIARGSILLLAVLFDRARRRPGRPA